MIGLVCVEWEGAAFLSFQQPNPMLSRLSGLPWHQNGCRGILSDVGYWWWLCGRERETSPFTQLREVAMQWYSIWLQLDLVQNLDLLYSTGRHKQRFKSHIPASHSLPHHTSQLFPATPPTPKCLLLLLASPSPPLTSLPHGGPSYH